MPIILKDEAKNFIPVPVGTHLARCYRMVQCGVQPDTGFGAKPKIVLTWELPAERLKATDGTGAEKPMTISQIYTDSFNPKSRLRQDLESWRGRAFTKDEAKAFSLNAVLGKPCQVSVIENEKGKHVLDGISSVPKGITVPPLENPAVEYSIDQGKDAVYKELPEWLRGMIDSGLQAKAEQAEAAASAASDEPPPPQEPEEGEPVPF